jgi:hypothetical protein
VVWSRNDTGAQQTHTGDTKNGIVLLKTTQARLIISK